MTYSPQVLSRVQEPKLAGALPKDDPDVGTGEAGSLDEGTLARISIRVDPGARRIGAARFKVFGCSAAIASASLVTEWLESAPVERARTLAPEPVIADLDLPAERAHVAAIVVEAARGAFADWERKRAAERNSHD